MKTIDEIAEAAGSGKDDEAQETKTEIEGKGKTNGKKEAKTEDNNNAKEESAKNQKPQGKIDDAPQKVEGAGDNTEKPDDKK